MKHIKHHEPLVKHHETLKHLSFDSISALGAAISAPGAEFPAIYLRSYTFADV